MRAIEEEILRLEDQRREAVLVNDVDALDDLLAPDAVTVTPDGGIHGRDAELAVNRAAARRVESWTSDEVVVRVYGDAAIVTQRAQIVDVIRGKSRTVRLRLTHVWTRSAGRWQLAARHASELRSDRDPPAPPR